MPIMDGIEATRQLRQAGCKTAIVALTAHVMPQDRQRCLDAGCDEYLPKPIGRAELLEAVARYLKKEPSPHEVINMAPDANALQEPFRSLPARVLLAEDTPDIQCLTVALLEEGGAEVKAVDHGKQAVEEALAAQRADRPFDVILMDMQMPVLDGYGATRQLRQSGYQGRIVALTAHAMAADRQKCLQAGCDDYLSKPIDPTRLVAVVTESVAAARARGTNLSPMILAPASSETEDVLRSQFADRPVIARLLPQFVGHLEERVRMMEESLRDTQLEELRRLAHQLKGSAGSYGYPSLFALAKVLEDEARLGRVDLAATTMQRVASLCRAVVRGCADTAVKIVDDSSSPQ